MAFAALAAIMLYLLLNIRSGEAAVADILLLLAAGIASALFATAPGAFARFRLPVSTLFLLAFLVYFLLRLLVDYPDPAEIKGITIGTSGGLIFALLLGAFVTVTLSLASPGGNGATLRPFLALGFLVAAAAASYLVCRSLLADVRADLFLIERDGRGYQRPGDFIAIAAMLLSFVVVQSTRRMAGLGVYPRCALLACVPAYGAAILFLMVSAQLIGSNKGFAVALGVAALTVLWMLRPDANRLRVARLGSGTAATPYRLIGLALPRFALTAVVFGGLTVAAVWIVLDLTGMEARQFRIFGFSGDSLGGSSLANRFELLSRNFLEQWALSPVFGNMRADVLTSGPGTYAHSLLSVFSHLGLLGACLFFAYLASVFNDLRRANRFSPDLDGNAEIGMFRVGLLLLLLLACTLAAFFSWMPLWFALGLACPPLSVNGSRFARLDEALRPGPVARATNVTGEPGYPG